MAYLYVFNQFCLSLEESSNPTLDHKLLQPKIDRRERLKSVTKNYWKVWHVIQSVARSHYKVSDASQIVTVIKTCDNYYEVNAFCSLVVLQFSWRTRCKCFFSIVSIFSLTRWILYKSSLKHLFIKVSG